MEYYAVPIFLTVMSIALIAVIYWGAMVEERRNDRRRAGT